MIDEHTAIKTNGIIIPEFNHLKNLIFLLIALCKFFHFSYLKLNKIIKSVKDRFIFLNKDIYQFKKLFLL